VVAAPVVRRARTVLTMPEEAAGGAGVRWRRGAVEERATAVEVQSLWTSGGWCCKTGACPPSNANVDHLLVGRGGVVHLDSKMWTSHLGCDGEQLWDGDGPSGRDVATAWWETEKVIAALARVLPAGWVVPGRTVLVVHDSPMPLGAVTAYADGELRMPPATLTDWLEGGERNGRQYEPVLRPEPLGINTITWGEMVEARYLRAYRTDLHISMQRLRPFIAKLREGFGVPFPLAHFRPFIDANRRLLLELQTASDLPQDLWVVYEFATGQTVLNPLLADNFLARIDFAKTGGQVAERIRPLGKNSPVVLDPRRSSAAATVGGVRTEILAEHALSDATVDEIADEFDLPMSAVKAALAWEWEAA